MRAVVAPDKFKGTFSAAEVAAAVAAGLREGGIEAAELPVADGGDGTARAMLQARGGEWRPVTAGDPFGRPVEAGFALLEGGRTAVVDVAEASGLWRLSQDELDPWRASTRGTGELIAAALAAGAEEVIVAAGGSGTADGGSGAVEVLHGLPSRPRIVVACDVTTPWEDSARIFGPQKGASEDDVMGLAARMDEQAAAAPRDPRGVPATGAAGGFSGAMWAYFGAELVPGAALVLDAVRFDEAIRGAAFVVTGEGQIDGQTLAGKAVGEVARRTAAAGLACDAVVGRNALSDEEQAELGIRTVLEAGDEERMRAAGRRLAEVAAGS